MKSHSQCDILFAADYIRPPPHLLTLFAPHLRPLSPLSSHPLHCVQYLVIIIVTANHFFFSILAGRNFAILAPSQVSGILSHLKSLFCPPHSLPFFGGGWGGSLLAGVRACVYVWYWECGLLFRGNRASFVFVQRCSGHKGSMSVCEK